MYVTDSDYTMIKNLLGSMKSFSQKDSDNIHRLRHALENAVIIDWRNIPADIVTMNSTVTVRDMNKNECSEYTLVYPEKADFRKGCISILAPLGSAILGCSVGDIIAWRVPQGEKSFLVEKIHYQPEAQGDLR